MTKRFNGQKLSHGKREVPRRKCPLCGNSMFRLRGELRCTEMRKSASAKGDGGQRRVEKHGSLSTIKHRLRQQATS